MQKPFVFLLLCLCYFSAVRPEGTSALATEIASAAAPNSLETILNSTTLSSTQKAEMVAAEQHNRRLELEIKLAATNNQRTEKLAYEIKDGFLGVAVMGMITAVMYFIFVPKK